MTTTVNFRRVSFLTSAARLDQCPVDEGREVAFAGRSNAGKSSAINCLSGYRSLARTSKTPGRTQLINFFDLGEQLRLVDLPGYGYAKVPQKVKESWSRNLDDYLRCRTSLVGLVLVMDSRHPFKPFDDTFIQWSMDANLPLHILLTKADKLNNQQSVTTLRQVSAQLKSRGDHLSCQLFSGTRATGLEDLEAMLNSWFCGEQPEKIATQ